MEPKRGLAGFVEADRPGWQKVLVVVFLTPFWATSHLRQTAWHVALRGLAIGGVWLLVLLVAAGASGPQPGEVRLETRERHAATPTATAEPEATSTPSPSPEAAPDEGVEGSFGGGPLDVPVDIPGLGSGSASTADALDRLDQLRVAAEGPRTGYDRNLFRHWIDADGDGCDTRREVLIEEALEGVVVGPGCSLSGGTWRSAYDGEMTTNPSTFDIDHMVPLAEAWDSGASSWSSSRREGFANDLGYEGSLIAVTASSNRSKGDRDPAEWKPPLSSYHCTYAVTWIEVKLRWELSADRAEVDALASMLDTCDGGQRPSTTAPPAPPPTSPPTQPPSGGTVGFGAMQCDSPGSPDDASNANGEYVTVVNSGSSAVNLDGWTISDEANHTYTFSGFTLGAGASVRLRSGSGSDTSTDVYWGRSQHVWNNDGDTAFLRDDGGGLVAQKAC